LNELLKDYQKPEDLLGKDGLLKQLQKRLLEKAMGAELTVHLGYDKHDATGDNSGNSRNGSTPKTLKGEFGNLALETPRDRNGTFEPQIVAKGQRRFEGFDQAIVSLYARGLTTREIEGYLLEIYGVEVSPGLVSQVTEAVCADVKVWQQRPLEEVYPSCILTRCGARYAPTGRSSKWRSTWRWGSRLTATRRCWGCGRPTAKGPSSGCTC